MQSRIRWIHWWIGFGFIAIFLATGVYMAIGIPTIDRMDHGQRMMMRSAHVYILLASLVNLVMGCYFQRLNRQSLGLIQLIGSIMIMVAPLLFLVAFFVEPEPARLNRPWSLAGAAPLALGVVFQAFAVFQSRLTESDSPD